MSSQSHADPRIGAVVDTYRIDALLGRGGMGTVYRGVHLWTEREVAIKFLLPHLSGNERNTRRFIREARAATALRHPNVVDVLHMGKHGADVYLVMELLHGKSLRALLQERVRLSEAEALAYVLPAMDALVRAHGLGVVHRDVKPDNIFLAHGVGDTIVPKLLDFGVAKLAEPTGSSGTAAGALMGTPQYMAPEQANCEQDVGPSADIWAIGMVLYECLTGGLPFRGAAALPALLFKLITEDVPSVTQERPDLSAHVAYAIDTALRRDRTARFSSMAELAAALRGPSFVADSSLSRADTLADVKLGEVAHSGSAASHEAASYAPIEQVRIPGWATHPQRYRGLFAVLVALGAVGVFFALDLISDPSPPPQAATSRHAAIAASESVPTLPPVGAALAAAGSSSPDTAASPEVQRVEREPTEIEQPPAAARAPAAVVDTRARADRSLRQPVASTKARVAPSPMVAQPPSIAPPSPAAVEVDNGLPPDVIDKF